MLSARFRLIACLILAALAAASVAAETPRGLWLTPRMDARNQARADVAGKMSKAPSEVWHTSTGGEVGFVRPVKVGGQDASLVQTGSNLQVMRWDSETVWRDSTSGFGRILHVGDFDGDKAEEVLVTTDARTVLLLDIATGDKLWTWQTAPSTQISGVSFSKTPTGIRFIAFPAYSLNGYCFDFSGDRKQPKLVWERNYAGKYGEGYGPSIVIKDMDGDGKSDIALSGKVPSVYQAVLDVDTGEIKADEHYSVEDQWGRPYGFLQARDLDRDGRPEFVMVSCQVEEYAAVARNVDGRRIEKMWSKFIEKDWPEDHKELRPQITSLADVQGNGKVELILGLWEDDVWHTLVIDPLKDFSAQRARLKGCYFWGCYDLTGDGIPEIIVSREKRRRPGRITTLLALDGRTMHQVATLDRAAVFGSGDSPLPDDTAFMAIRQNPVYVKADDGTGGILVRRFQAGSEIGTYLWGSRNGRVVTRHIAGPGYVRADAYPNALCLSDSSGGIRRFDGKLRPVGERLPTSGRTCQPLVCIAGGKRQIVFDVAGGKVRGGSPNLEDGGLDGEWTVMGSMPALHVDAYGVCRLAVADNSDPDKPAALVYTLSPGPGDPVRIPLDYPAYLGLTPFGREYRLLVNLQTGVHTMALACYDGAGRMLWQDTGQGAHPRVPGTADLDGDGNEEVVADDHGVFRIYSSSGSVLGTHNGWPPAYTLPISGPFGPGGRQSRPGSSGGETMVLRASGIDAVSMVDKAAQEIWRMDCDRWRYYRGLGAAGDLSGSGHFALGMLREDGLFECIDAESGKPRWSLEVGEPSETSIVAGDVNGDGKDEFVFGMRDGRLVCISEGRVLWQMSFPAAVANPIIADLDGDGIAEVIISTSDGFVRVLDDG